MEKTGLRKYNYHDKYVNFELPDMSWSHDKINISIRSATVPSNNAFFIYCYQEQCS